MRVVVALILLAGSAGRRRGFSVVFRGLGDTPGEQLTSYLNAIREAATRGARPRDRPDQDTRAGRAAQEGRARKDPAPHWRLARLPRAAHVKQYGRSIAANYRIEKIHLRDACRASTSPANVTHPPRRGPFPRVLLPWANDRRQAGSRTTATAGPQGLYSRWPTTPSARGNRLALTRPRHQQNSASATPPPSTPTPTATTC